MFTGTLEGTWQYPIHQDNICGSLTHFQGWGVVTEGSIVPSLTQRYKPSSGLEPHGKMGKIPRGCYALDHCHVELGNRASSHKTCADGHWVVLPRPTRPSCESCSTMWTDNGVMYSLKCGPTSISAFLSIKYSIDINISMDIETEIDTR